MASVADSIPPVSAKAARILLLTIPVVKKFLAKFTFLLSRLRPMCKSRSPSQVFHVWRVSFHTLKMIKLLKLSAARVARKAGTTCRL